MSVHSYSLILSHLYLQFKYKRRSLFTERVLRTNVLYVLYYIEHIFGCQHFFENFSNKYSEYMFAFCFTLCYYKFINKY